MNKLKSIAVYYGINERIITPCHEEFWDTEYNLAHVDMLYSFHTGRHFTANQVWHEIRTYLETVKSVYVVVGNETGGHPVFNRKEAGIIRGWGQRFGWY